MVKDIVMLAAVDWDFIAQAQQIFAKNFAERGLNIVYVEPFPHRMPRLTELFKVLARFKNFLVRSSTPPGVPPAMKEKITVITPIAFPETNRIFIYLNKVFFVKLIGKRVNRLCTSSPVVHCWTPYEACLDLSRELKPILLLYSCVDNFLALTNSPKHIEETEKKFLRNSDLVVAKSEYVANRLRKTRKAILMRDSAVDFDMYQKANTGLVKEAKRLCFFGAISDRLDFNIINGLGEKGYEVILMGPFRSREVSIKDLHENVIHIPPVPYEQVPVHLRNVDTIILPYKMNSEFNKGMQLAKIYECFATGKPVVATAIPCLEKFRDIVYFGFIAEEFDDIIRSFPETETEEKYLKRVKLARANSWPERVSQELAWMNTFLKKKNDSINAK